MARTHQQHMDLLTKFVHWADFYGDWEGAEIADWISVLTTACQYAHLANSDEMRDRLMNALWVELWENLHCMWFEDMIEDNEGADLALLQLVEKYPLETPYS